MRNAQRPRIPKIEDLHLFITKDPVTKCWNWIRTASTRGGYCQVQPPGDRAIYAHRWVFENLCSTIPIGFDLHHKCQNRKCVNPDHLELVHETKHKKKFHSRRSIK